MGGRGRMGWEGGGGANGGGLEGRWSEETDTKSDF